MALNTNTYGYVIDPLFSFCDQGGKTIANGYVRVFRAGTSTPVLTYRNFDGAFNAETIELDNSGRTMTKVIASKGDLYKVCVYDAEHSQESPVLTVDKVAVIGASVNATNIVQGMNDVAGSGWINSVSADDTAEISLDATNVTSEVDTMVKATSASADYMMPLVHKTGSDPDKKITLGNIFKFVLNFIHSLTDTATESDIVSGNYFALDGSAGTKKLNSTTLLTKTAQNALAGNVAPAFDPTRDEEHPYLAGEKVVYSGVVYLFLVSHYGPWVESDVERDESVDNLQQELSSRISALEKEIDGGTIVFSESTTWGTNLNGKWKIGELFSNKTFNILVSCENPPASSVTIYFSTGSYSDTIISSETKTVTIGQPLEITVHPDARYIWVWTTTSSGSEKEVTLELIDVASVISVKQELIDLKSEMSGELILSGSLVWGNNLNSNYISIGDRFAGKKINILVSCENPPASSVTIYFSTGSGSSSIIYAETKTAVIGTPLEVIVPETARYIRFFSATTGNSDVVTYSVSYVDDLTHRVENLETAELDLPTMSCEVSSNSIQIKQNLGDGKSRRVVFSKFGPSNIMQLKSVAVYGSSGEILSAKSTGTDSLGPFVVRAVNNADGTNMESPKFTGGCHGYNGDQTGAATASCEVKVVADGKEISSGSRDCFNLSVIVTNKVQGWNTRKSDGTGREIIKETITYKISSSLDRILVSSDIEALEDVVFELYYGLQIAFARDAIRFTCGEFSDWLTTDYPSYSGDTLDSVDGKSTDGFYQEMGLENKGLGHFEYTGNNPKAFRSNTKGYYSLIRGDVSVVAGKIIRLAGYYSFNFIGSEVTPIKFGSFDVDNSSIDKYFSVEDLPEGVYKLKYYLSGENNGNGVVTTYTASGHNNGSIIATYTGGQGVELTISITASTKIIWMFSSGTAKTELSYVLYQ